MDPGGGSGRRRWEGREKLPEAEMGRWWELARPTLRTEAGTQQTRRGCIQGEAQTADAYVARSQARAAGREDRRGRAFPRWSSGLASVSKEDMSHCWPSAKGDRCLQTRLGSI